MIDEYYTLFCNHLTMVILLNSVKLMNVFFCLILVFSLILVIPTHFLFYKCIFAYFWLKFTNKFTILLIILNPLFYFYFPPKLLKYFYITCYCNKINIKLITLLLSKILKIKLKHLF